MSSFDYQQLLSEVPISIRIIIIIIIIIIILILIIIIIIMIIIINIFIVQIPCEYDQMCVPNVIHNKLRHNKLRLPTGGRLTSWLFTRRGGVEFGATEDKSI